MSDDRRWFLQHAGQPWREVTKQEWLQAEHDAGFRGGGMREPSTGAWSGGSAAGMIVYPGQELPGPTVEVTYEWGVKTPTHWMMPGGAIVWEAFDQDGQDAEDNARSRVDRLNRFEPGSAVLVRRRVEVYDWEEAG